MAFSEATQDAIVIGIDFGTTFSGVSWAFSRDPDQIEMITSWQSELAHCSDLEKVPSRISFNTSQGDKTNWGYAVQPEEEPLQWFKLLLLDEKDVPIEVASSKPLREARRLMEKIDQEPTQIIGCYLRHLWNHSIDNIKRSVGPKLLESCVFHVVITLPAIWPPYAQRRMRMAVELSGILAERPCGETTLRFISEPEAAALATLRDLSKRPTTQAGDTLVVCDAGGGTVDLISYVVESTSPFVVKECVKGEGGLCGGVFLDEEFIKLVGRRAQGNWEKLSLSDRSKFLNEYWEHGAKLQFKGTDEVRTWLVELPVKDANQLGRFKKRLAIDLTSHDILSVFNPIIKKVKMLVQSQVSQVLSKHSVSPKYIVLVGGFGRNSYLYNQLQKDFNNSTILQGRGNQPWTAICRGAVLFGLDQRNLTTSLQIKVEARIARLSYGISVQCPWVEGEYLQCDKIWDENEQEYKANNQMRWFLKQGATVEIKYPIRRSLYHLCDNQNEMDGVKLYYSSASPLPQRQDQSTIHSLCTISFNRVAIESLPTWTNKIGKIFRKLKFDIEMTSDGGYLDFTVYHDGKRIGGESVKVQFD